MKKNINSPCTVVLTPYGEDVLQEYVNNLVVNIPSEYRKDVRDSYSLDTGGMFTAPLWKIMNIFGEHIYQGAKNCFVNNEIDF